MKTTSLLTLLMFLAGLGVHGQTFTDDFESYNAGDLLAQSSSDWTTWSGTSGGADDMPVTNIKAKSGSNSLYFSSSLANGGPDDIVLPFGGEYSSGTFSVSFWIFVETGKSAYFNLQESSTTGEGWTLDADLGRDGSLSLGNTLSGELLNTIYLQNTWFKLEILTDLNTNSWELLIDNVSKGTFQNSYRQVAALNLYPPSGSGFYVDDVSYTYIPYSPIARNGTVTFIDGVADLLAGQQGSPVVEIRNLGTQTITSAEIEVSYNNNTLTETVSGLNLSTFATHSVALDDVIELVPGANALIATITKVNGQADDDASDDSKTLILDPVVPAPAKLVIAEEATGTWCGWCPRGSVALEELDALYPGLIQSIAVHNGDPMADQVYDDGIGPLISGYPSAVVDRGNDIDPSAIKVDFLKRITVAPKATITNGAEYNSISRELRVSLTTEISEALSGNYKIACVIIEDDVTGTDPKYAQVNYYAGGGNGPMGGYENLPNPVPPSQMVYDHVARSISPNFRGLPNAFGASASPGQTFTHNFTFELNPEWKSEKIHIIALFIDPSGMIDNGSSTTIAEAETNGYEEGTTVTGVEMLSTNSEKIRVFPNPATEQFNLFLGDQGPSDIMIYDMHGKLTYNRGQVSVEALSIDAHEWRSGIYLVKVIQNGKMQQLKIVKD